MNVPAADPTRRALLLALAVYVPHLLQEHVEGMWRDPVVAPALAPLAGMSGSQAGYVVFQIMFAGLLALPAVWMIGPRARALLLGALGLALVAESHHVVRAIASGATNAGLWTSLPMPLVGALVVWRAARQPPSGGGKAKPRTSAFAVLAFAGWLESCSFWRR